MDFWIQSGAVPEYPFSKTYKDLAEETFIILHTSGSTGLPKPIPIKHNLWMVQDNFNDVPKAAGREIWLDRWTPGLRSFLAFPPFHVRTQSPSVYR
jgi:acyl-CoA synthetase (AMP-forming)/AMP-acid ligase II